MPGQIVRDYKMVKQKWCHSSHQVVFILEHTVIFHRLCYHLMGLLLLFSNKLINILNFSVLIANMVNIDRYNPHKPKLCREGVFNIFFFFCYSMWDRGSYFPDHWSNLCPSSGSAESWPLDHCRIPFSTSEKLKSSETKKFANHYLSTSSRNFMFTFFFGQLLL